MSLVRGTRAQLDMAHGRVDWIADEMREGRWHSGLIAHVARDWGLHPAMLGTYVREAARRVMRGMGGHGAMALALTGRLRTLEEAAASSKDYGAAVRAIEVSAKLMGLLGGKDSKREGEPPDWATLSPAQRMERIREGRERLDALEAEACADMATLVDSES